jgi:hypothetical protein
MGKSKQHLRKALCSISCRYTAGKKHGKGYFTWADCSSYDGEDSLDIQNPLHRWGNFDVRDWN